MLSYDSIMNKPPYDTTPAIISLISSTSEKIGAFQATHLIKPSPELRRKNRIKTITASLAIEGNTLSEEQITAVLENKKILGPAKEIKEVQNAIEVYDQLADFEAGSLKSFLKAHRILMTALVDNPGELRTGEVGIIKGSKVKHLAPQAKQLPQLMTNLFDYIQNDDELNLIKSLSLIHI